MTREKNLSDIIRDWAENAVRDVVVVDFEYNPRKTFWDVSDRKSTMFQEKLLPKLQQR